LGVADVAVVSPTALPALRVGARRLGVVNREFTRGDQIEVWLEHEGVGRADRGRVVEETAVDVVPADAWRAVVLDVEEPAPCDIGGGSGVLEPDRRAVRRDGETRHRAAEGFSTV